MEMDPETMKLALRITLAEDDDVLQGVVQAGAQRPWYARHLKVKRPEA